MVPESARESGDPAVLGRRHRGLPRRESGGGADRRKTSASIFGRFAASKIPAADPERRAEHIGSGRLVVC